MPKRDPLSIPRDPPWHEDNPVGVFEGAPRVVRHSAMADFRQCPLKWWLKWVRGWQPREASDASSLGTLWHAVMAAHYGALKTVQDLNAKLNRAEVNDRVQPTINYYKETKHYETLQWMYSGYLEEYGTDPHWEIIEVESTQTVEMHPGLLYEWTTDLLVRDHSLPRSPLRVVDNKSSSNILRKGEIDLSDQLGLYVKAQTKRGDRVVDGVWNQARTQKLVRPMTLEERYQRLPSYKSPIEMDNIWDDAIQVAEKMLEFEAEAEVAAAQGLFIAPYSAPDPRVCSWKCDYKEEHLILRKMPKARWEQRLGPLMAKSGFEQKAVPRGSDAPKVQ